jgi:NTP pyrophosphatase (non-canonical NTP hydrolase)
MSKSEQTILQASIDRWGLQLQLMILIEECGELIQAAAKYQSGRVGSPKNLIEEVADVSIMVDQIRCKWGKEIDVVRTQKIARLAGRLEEVP